MTIWAVGEAWERHSQNYNNTLLFNLLKGLMPMGRIDPAGNATFIAASGIAINDTLTISAGQVDFNSDTSVENLTVSGGTLNLNGATVDLTVNSGFSWSGGDITGTTGSTFTTAGTGTMTNTSVVNLTDVAWTNNGTITYTGTANLTGTGTINNVGTFTYNSTSNITMAPVFNNTDTVNVFNTGRLTLSAVSASTDNGIYNLSNASGEIVSANTRTFGSSANFQGTGLVIWSGTIAINTSNFASTLSIRTAGGITTFNNSNTVASLEITSGELTISSGITLTASTAFNWQSGIFSGLGTLSTGVGVTGTMSNGSSNRTISGSTFIWNNAGNITFSGGGFNDFVLDSGATFNNSGTFEITATNGSNINTSGSGTETINNTGTFTHNSTSATTVAPEFNNLVGGTVNVTNTGTLNIAAGNTNATSDIGDYSVTNASGAINFNGGTRTFTSTVGFTGSGGFTFSSTGITTFTNVTMNNTGTVTFSGSDLTTGGTNLSITTSDITISSALDVGTGDLTIIASGGGDIGLGDTTTNCGGACEMTISKTELQNITAGNLILGDTNTANVYVDNIAATDLNGISGTVILNATAAGSVVTFDTAAFTFKTLAVNAENGISVTQNLTADTGGMSFNADSDDDGTGTLTVSDSVTINSTNQSLKIIADDLVMNTTGALNAGTGTVTIVRSNGGAIGPGSAGTGNLNISDVELNNITAKNVNLGDGTGGTITSEGVAFTDTDQIGTLTLTSGRQVQFGGSGHDFTSNMVIVAGTNISMGNTTRILGTSSFTVTGNGFLGVGNSFSDFTGAVTIVAGTANVTVTDTNSLTLASVTVGGTLTESL